MALVTARRTPVFSSNVSSVRSSITWPPSVSSSTRLIQACSPSARARVTARRKRIKSGPAALKADELTKVDRRRVVDEIKRDYTDAKQGLGAQVGVNGPRPRRVLRARGGTFASTARGARAASEPYASPDAAFRQPPDQATAPRRQSG